MIISEYLAAADRGDVDAVVGCFAEDAVVVDEGPGVSRPARIRQWRETLATAFEYTVEVRGTAVLGEVDGVDRHEVCSHLKGNFPGSTVDLTNRFGLRDGRIASLEIRPTEAAQT